MATLETSLEANYDRRTPHGRTKRLIGARATTLPKNQKSLSIISAQKYISKMVKYSKRTFEYHISNEKDPIHVRFIFSEKIGKTMHVIII